jgi:polysaccharide biosynthesis transport protein
MTIRQFLLVLWARKWIIFSMAIFGLAVAIAISYLLSPRYRAETTVLVDYKTMDPVSGAMLTVPGYLSTQIDIVQSHRVALKVD